MNIPLLLQSRVIAVYSRLLLWWLFCAHRLHCGNELVREQQQQTPLRRPPTIFEKNARPGIKLLCWNRSHTTTHNNYYIHDVHTHRNNNWIIISGIIIYMPDTTMQNIIIIQSWNFGVLRNLGRNFLPGTRSLATYHLLPHRIFGGGIQK